MTKPIARDVMYRGRAFEAEVIELCVRWHITYRLSYRDLVEIMAERGIQVEWTRPTFRFAGDGTTCIVQSTNMARRSTFSCVETVGLQPRRLAGIELAHRIRKRQFVLGRSRRRRGWSLSASRLNEPQMHQNRFIAVVPDRCHQRVDCPSTAVRLCEAAFALDAMIRAPAPLRSEMNTLPSGVGIDDHTNAPTSNALIATDRPKQIGLFINSPLRGD